MSAKSLIPKTETSAIEAALIENDLSKLSPNERLSYYKQVCESQKLNHLTQPFGYLKLNGKLVLYAKRDATDQLRKIHSVSIEITRQELVGDIYIVTAKATTKDGRYDEATGAVPVTGLKGNDLANAYLKCETKAKRRVTLSICGLGFLDETEVETIADAKPARQAKERRQIPNHAPGMEGEPSEAEILEPEVDDPLEAIGEMTCPLKKFKGQRIRDISRSELDGYVRWLDDFARQQGREPSGQAKEFIEAAKVWLESAQ